VGIFVLLFGFLDNFFDRSYYQYASETIKMLPQKPDAILQCPDISLD